MNFKNSLMKYNYFSYNIPNIITAYPSPALNMSQENLEFELDLSKKTNCEEYIKYIYINRKYLFDMLFDLEEKICIKGNVENNIANNKIIYFLYYLCLLIEENKDMIYFTYSFDFIKNIKSYLSKLDNTNIIMNIISSKILLVLINNYFAENGNNSNIQLSNIKKELEKNITKNSEKLKEINIDLNKEEIFIKNLDDIYADIILSLLKNEINNNIFKQKINILSQLNLDNIDMLSENNYERINLTLKERNFKKKYLIKKLEDFSDINKINIYFILLKYILKNPLYIYQIPFLLEAREILLKKIKTNKEQILHECNNNQIFVLKKLFDSEYYIKKYLQLEENYDNHPEFDIDNDDVTNKINDDNRKDLEDINEVLNFYKKYKFESKKNDIRFIETSMKTKTINDCKKYLNDLKEAKEMNLKYPIIYFYYLNSGNKDKPLIEKELKNSQDSYLEVEKLIKNQKLNKIQAKFNKIFYEYFKNPKNDETINKIYSKEVLDLYLKFNRLKEILLYYRCFLFESKANQIKIIDKIIKDKAFKDIDEYLKDLEIAEKMNLRYQIIYSLYKEEFKEDKISSENKLNQIVSIWNEYIEKSINEKETEYNDLSFEIKNKLISIFNDKDKEEYLLKIFSKESIDFFKKLEFNENEKEINFISEIKTSRENYLEDETTFKTKILPSFVKYNENSELSLNEDDLLLMFDIYGDKNNEEITQEQYNCLLKKYQALKNSINDGKKNK